MSERLNYNFESGEKDRRELEKAIEKQHEKIRESHESVDNNPESIDKILEKIERQAKSKHELHPHENHEKANDSETRITGHSLQSLSFERTMQEIQQQLPRHQRTFSKIIHNKGVEKVSNIAGATVARPSGLFAGGVFSLVASVAVLIICNYYGYEYNFMIAIATFVGGFAAGLLFELIYKLLRR